MLIKKIINNNEILLSNLDLSVLNLNGLYPFRLVPEHLA